MGTASTTDKRGNELMKKISINKKLFLTTLILLPMAFDGRFLRNLARTAPLLPCGLVTLPQITLMWFGFLSLRPAIAVLLKVLRLKVFF